MEPVKNGRAKSLKENKKFKNFYRNLRKLLTIPGLWSKVKL